MHAIMTVVLILGCALAAIMAFVWFTAAEEAEQRERRSDRDQDLKKRRPW
jgi:hypothetical protein